jgi:hypothetical protein
MKTFKKTISFIDADKHRATITTEITKRNGYFEFTATGEYCGSGGQCLDSIKPKTDKQTELINLWKKYHLNGMNPGTKEQNAYIKRAGLIGDKYNYDQAIKLLKSANLYEVKHPETNKPYKYGEGWIINKLPANFDDYVLGLLATIENEEIKAQNKREEEELSEDDKLLSQMEEYGIDENMFDACRAYLEYMETGATLKDFEECYEGDFVDDEEFARNMAENTCQGDFKDLQWPLNCIDWEEAAYQLMADYTEQDGFYFRT